MITNFTNTKDSTLLRHSTYTKHGEHLEVVKQDIEEKAEELKESRTETTLETCIQDVVHDYGTYGDEPVAYERLKAYYAFYIVQRNMERILKSGYSNMTDIKPDERQIHDYFTEEILEYMEVI